MKITEMNDCIEEMRKVYDFNDDNAEIELHSGQICGCGKMIVIRTKAENGTEIRLKREAETLFDLETLDE